MAPSSTQANQASIASMQLSRWISTYSPGLTPRLESPAASAPARSLNSPYDQLRAGAPNGAQIKKGWLRRLSARIRSSHDTSRPANGPTTPGAAREMDMVPPVQLCLPLWFCFGTVLPLDGAVRKL